MNSYNSQYQMLRYAYEVLWGITETFSCCKMSKVKDVMKSTFKGDLLQMKGRRLFHYSKVKTAKAKVPQRHKQIEPIKLNDIPILNIRIPEANRQSEQTLYQTIDDRTGRFTGYNDQNGQPTQQHQKNHLSKKYIR